MNDINMKLQQIQKKREWLEKRQAWKVSETVVKEIADSRWFKQDDAPITFDERTNTFTAKIPKQKQAYLSYGEPNTNFAVAPLGGMITSNSNGQCVCRLDGTISKDVEVSLMLAFYHGGQKIETASITWGKVSVVHVPAKTDSIRAGLRIKGKGTFQIEQLSINDLSLWETNQQDQSFLQAGRTNWYVLNKDRVSYIEESASFLAQVAEGEHVYVTYKEANMNFANAPQSPIAIGDQPIPVLFEGEKDGDVEVRLFVVLYQHGERKHIHQILLNDTSLIETDGADSMRLAIRIAGTGRVKLKTVAVAGNGYWLAESLYGAATPIEPYMLHVPVTKDKLFGLEGGNDLLYHPAQHVFESRLVGEQFAYLPILENIGVNEAPQQSLLQPKHKHYYEIYAGAQIYGSTSLTLFLAGYRNGKRQELHQVPFGQKTVIAFHEHTTDVKAFVRVQQSGYFNSLYIGINEHEIEVTNRLELDLQPAHWFPSAKTIAFSSDNGGLVGESTLETDKKAYVSYKETNNSFNLMPTVPLMSIDKNHVYEFTVTADAEEGMELLPMVVGYSNDQKVQVLQLKLNQPTTVRFQPDVKQIRIAMRIGGAGRFKLKRFAIEETESMEMNKKLEWVNKREVEMLGLAPLKPLHKLQMAVIFDEFTTASYKEECELITFTPNNWLEVLTQKKPDLLMVESAWNGNGGSWLKRVGYYGEEAMQPLFALLAWCKLHNIPTVFWNKEDPVHFERFIETARRFDYIFTTDENVVPNYKEKAGHDRVYALPFAAQPVIHNPIKITDMRENKACFAGSYYRHHEDRVKDMDRVLDYAAKYGLDIFDRNYEKNKKGLMPNHRFPERFNPYIKGSLKYYEIDKAYKGYKVMINVNTVKYSPTMFSRRVFEGLACGTPVVSTYAQGIENMFGDLVYISENEEEIDAAFRSLLHDEDEYRRKALLGIREVLSKHTYTHRLKYVANQVGLHVTHQLPKVTVLAFAHSKEEFFRALEQFERQEYEQKELYVLVDTFEGYLDLFTTYNNARIKTFVRSYMHNYQNMLEWIATPYVTHFAGSDYYGRFYLSDLMLATTYTNSDCIGKHAYFAAEADGLHEYHGQAEYEFSSTMGSARAVAKTDVFAKESLTHILDELEQGMDFGIYFKFGKTLYSSDKYNYLHNAYAAGDMKPGIAQIEI